MGDDIRILALQSGQTPLKRLDKEISALVPEADALSRSRIAALIRAGCLTDRAGRVLDDPSARGQAGQHYRLTVPAAEDARLEPEAIPLEIPYEDAAVIVINKPAGMVVHPAPGAWTGTLVSALLYHCGDSLSGIGGERRPGIVHRLDKDTSGVMVAAKTDQAHHALSAQFAAHSVARQYRALVWGVPDPASARLRGLEAVDQEPDGRLIIRAAIDRHKTDRKKMAVTETGGRHAVTRIRIEEDFGPAAEVTCQLETGRTHQIRVHMTHIGHALIGDPVYGRARSLPKSGITAVDRANIAGFSRQALHAEHLGFAHPVTGEMMTFSAPLPPDMAQLRAALAGTGR